MMNRLGLIATHVIFFLFPSIAIAQENCIGNVPRMIDVQSSILWCINDPNANKVNVMNNNSVIAPARSVILFGRYHSDYAPMVKLATCACQEGQEAHQNCDFCDEASFWAAAVGVLPEDDYPKYAEAQRNPYGSG